MKLLLDINVLMDFLQHRRAFALPAAKVFGAVEMRRARGYVAGHTITTAYYLLRRGKAAPIAESAILTLLRVLEVVPVEREDMMRALALGWMDFEDAVQAICASKVGADYIVTRDLQDF